MGQSSEVVGDPGGSIGRRARGGEGGDMDFFGAIADCHRAK